MTSQRQYMEALALQSVDRAIEAQLGPAMRAGLEQTGRATVVGGIPFVAMHVAEPAPLLPTEGFTPGLNDRVISLVNGTAGTTALPTIAFDLDSAIYALTAAVYDTDGNAFPPTNFANALDTFTVQFKLAQGRQYQDNAALGSAVLGDAKYPRYLGMPAWRFPGGTVLQVLLTPLVANLRIDLTLWAIELTPMSGNFSG
jgi:hypothetical protein